MTARTRVPTTAPDVPATERANPASEGLDQLSALEIVRLMNAEDALIAGAVEKELPQVARAVEAIVARSEGGGRLVYVGAGTSGRIATLEAAEVRPTFGVPVGQVIGIMAGGPTAFGTAVEGAEDDAAAGAAAVRELELTPDDSVVGVSASGRTSFVLGAIAEAHQIGAFTVGVSCDPAAPLAQAVEIAISPLVGPEIVAGSTRLKAGTAQKLVLNMLTTATMVRLGHVRGNLMIDVQATNAKLRARARRIVQEITGASAEEADDALRASGGSARAAILVLHRARAGEGHPHA